jgi:DNA mismatch repair protein MutS2
MELEPRDLFEKLEFDKVRQLVVGECLGDLGKAAAAKLYPMTKLKDIDRSLREVSAMKRSFDEDEAFPLTTYDDLADDLKLLEIQDSVLPIEGLQRIHKVLSAMRDILGFFSDTRRETYEYLYNIVRSVELDPDLIKEIDSVVDDEGQIRPDASPELSKIRKTIGSKHKELDKVFRSLINDYRSRGWLTDNVESFRNGRRVLSVPAEHKRKIRGIIHDESATGKTAFIEPDGVININNDIFDLQQREKREILRILKALSATLRPYVPFMRVYQELLIRYDVIGAKARIGMRMEAKMPKLIDRPNLKILEGYHPLLLLKNKQIDKVTVPFTLDLHKPNRILMLSGPNAGGKSITMKSVGLMQLMVQSGMLVPAEEESLFGIYTQIFADIGDQQSIEDDLSTYSSRLRNMRIFTEKADRNTLVLIDEFGSGTDPKIGGAIAEAILVELNNKKVFGVVTTHYSNLKIFSFKTKGMLNGSMHFDKDTLSPTYELRVGRPGSSYAFEIAEKSGLSGQIMKYARRRTGKSDKAVDQLLVDLQREKQELEEKLATMQERENQLDRLIKTYDQLHKDLEVRRKRIKLEAKEQALQQTAEQNREFEQLIRELKEQQKEAKQIQAKEEALQKAKEMAAQVREERKQLNDDVTDLREAVYYEPSGASAKKGPIKVGDFVKLKTGGSTGTVESVDKKSAVVQMGAMRMTVKLRDLQHANEPLNRQDKKSVYTEVLERNANFESRIDIRGMRFDEALQTVETLVDEALVNGTTNLRILHGKGSGALRKAVRQKLREYNVDMQISHPAAEHGGDGVTLVDLS